MQTVIATPQQQYVIERFATSVGIVNIGRPTLLRTATQASFTG
jgi:hypothetical protein